MPPAATADPARTAPARTAPALTVRAATGADLERLVEGNLAMARETEGIALDPAVLRAGVEAGLRGQRDARYFLASRGDQLAGQLMLTTEWSDWRNAPVWWIQSVYVWPAHRRTGVYAALHAHVLDRARREGAAGLRLYVERDNSAAQATYAAVGMDGDHYRLYEQMLVRLPLAAPDKP